MSAKIKAVRVHRYAGLDQDGKPLATPGPLSGVISIDEIDAPQCTDGHVLISANYAGVQYPDALQAQGLYQQKPDLPYVPGMDLTGTVLEVGAGVDHVAVGERVIAQMSIGALA
jgi:NADPH:quinone reductase